jgi:hypothetical protein
MNVTRLSASDERSVAVLNHLMPIRNPRISRCGVLRGAVQLAAQLMPLVQQIVQ